MKLFSDSLPSRPLQSRSDANKPAPPREDDDDDDDDDSVLTGLKRPHEMAPACLNYLRQAEFVFAQVAPSCHRVITARGGKVGRQRGGLGVQRGELDGAASSES